MSNSHLLNVYNRAEPLFVRGEGPWLYDDRGEAWLDCVSGIATRAGNSSSQTSVAHVRARMTPSGSGR